MGERTARHRGAHNGRARGIVALRRRRAVSGLAGLIVLAVTAALAPAALTSSAAQAATSTVVVKAGADARVSKGSPNANVGTATTLGVDGSPVLESYLKFTVPATVPITGAVTRAVLRLYATDGSADGPAVYPSATSWSETKITWNVRPARTGAALDDKAKIATGSWSEYDVTSAVPGAGTYSFDLAQTSADATVFASRENGTSSRRPQLVLTVDDGAAADTAPPETLITSAPQGTVGVRTASVAFTADEPATFECRLDSAAFAPCVSPQSYSGLADGGHEVLVRATDTAGNVDATPASATWTVDTGVPDTTPPETVITSAPQGTVGVRTASVAFTADEPATFECRLDSAAFASCVSPQSYSGLADGGHEVQVRATDAAGNVDESPATATWTVQVAAPPGAWQAVDVASTVGLRVKTGTEGHLCVVDADADGRADVVLSKHGQDLWPLMRQAADGTFSPSVLFGPVTDRHSCASGDFASVRADGSFGPPDGRVDFYTTTGACQGNCTKPYPNNLYVQRPDGSFAEGAAALGVDDPHGRGRDAVTVDVDADGDDDIYLTNQVSTLYVEPNRVYQNLAPGFVERGDPDATLQTATACVRTGDFNGDGRTDIVVCTTTRPYFLANTVDGLVDVRASLGVPSNEALRDVALKDFNGDGHLDLATVGRTRFTVRLWSGPVDSYAQISYQLALKEGRSLAVGDMFGRGDGRDVYLVDGWTSGQTRQWPDVVLQWTGSPGTTSFTAHPVPQPPDTGSGSPMNGQGDQVSIVPDWAGSGRGLAVVSNGLFGSGYYQAITMQPAP